MKVIIIGGVAGGASCAARLRRLDERAEIILVERGPYVSYANCGLPYHVGGVIQQESKLLVVTEDYLRTYFNLDVRTNWEAVAISPAERLVQLKNVSTGEVKTEGYDRLVLSPGGDAIRPPLPGIDLPGIFPVRTVPDARAIRAWVERSGAVREGRRPGAVVVGGGFIGLEMAENLVHRGFDVTIVEMLEHVLGPIDAEHAMMVEAHLESHGVRLAMGDAVASFRRGSATALEVSTRSGKQYSADVVILALGVRPNVSLAREAGLAIGELGGIQVDEHMRTSDPNIFAVGDAVEVSDFVTGRRTLIPLAGPANRQGRIAADVIAGRSARYRGTQGTSIIGLFGAVIAWTGVSEKMLRRIGDTDYERFFIYPNSHAAYYPGARPIMMKVIFRRSDGRLLGVQAFGEDGVDKRVSAIAALIQMRATVYDLEESELCYAPQFGSAKDPVNFAGMVGANLMRGDFSVAGWESAREGYLLDVREAHEYAAEYVPQAVNIPLPQLRARLAELPRDREIHVICRAGLRGYVAVRILLQHGYTARVVTGGMLLISRIDPDAVRKKH
jgi:NADPH-dependent 2,4-dienoyl-CoA reductase/sulfur reductase-like enzyme/rhodanese-related sulfurtransferase